MSNVGSYRVSAQWRPRYRYAWTLSHIQTGFWGGGNPTPLYASYDEARKAQPDLQFEPVRVRVTIAEPSERG